MQTWVNDRLSNYYTIAQVDAMLGSLEQTFNSKLETQKSYLTGLINSLQSDLNNKITSNKNLIATLRTDASHCSSPWQFLQIRTQTLLQVGLATEWEVMTFT